MINSESDKSIKKNLRKTKKSTDENKITEIPSETSKNHEPAIDKPKRSRKSKSPQPIAKEESVTKVEPEKVRKPRKSKSEPATPEPPSSSVPEVDIEKPKRTRK